ncbi:MAG: ThuA domain-containing protein [Cyclobacteriaceae bacterium]
MKLNNLLLTMVVWTVVMMTFVLRINAQSITGLTLINAETNLDLTQLNDGDVINFQELPTTILNVRANTSGIIGSVAFRLNGSIFQTENVAPFALAGDISGNYKSWTPDLGLLSIEAIVFSGADGAGSPLDTLSIDVTFIDQPVEIFVTDVSFINCPVVDLLVGDTVDLDVAIAPLDATNQTIAFTASDGLSVGYLSGEFIGSSPGQITVTATSFSDGGVFDQCVISVVDPLPVIDPYNTVQAEDFSAQSGTRTGGSGIAVGYINDGDFIRFDNVDFGRGPTSGVIRGASKTSGGQVEFRTESVNGPLLATADIAGTGGWSTFQNFSINVLNADSYENGTVFLGTQTLFVVFRGGNGFLFDVDEFSFSTADVVIQDLSFINCPTEPLYVGDVIDLDVAITPINTTNQTIAFTASDGTSVDYLSGEFTAVMPGEITVTATSFSDGGVFDQCVITILDTLPPQAPGNLEVSLLSQGIASLTWADSSTNENGFEIEARDFYFGTSYELLTTLPAYAVSFIDSTFNAGANRTYRVRAFNDVGVSSFSNSAGVNNIPFPPNDLLIDEVTSNSFRLSFNQPSFGNDYLVESSLQPDSGFTFLDGFYFGIEEMVYGGLVPNTTYYFRISTNFEGNASDFVNFTVTTLPDGLSVADFLLVDADSDLDIGTLNDGDTLNLFYLPNLNVRVETNPDSVGSVGFAYNGDPGFATENIKPYALAGDTGGDYKPFTFAIGANSLKATPFSTNNRGGDIGQADSVSFYVINQDTTTIPPDTTIIPPVISGELKKWHKVTLSFTGPETDELAATNPFADYRLDVIFTNGAKSYTVPGYYAADGNAANTSANTGNIWQVNFSPDEAGIWSYTASFRRGIDIAISSNPNDGFATSFDGQSGTFDIIPSDKTGRDFRAKGRLQYVGEHYLQFAETGEYFFKVGADAPENTFAYEDFDATPNNSNRRKNWQPHIQDFDAAVAGAYTWGAIASDGSREKGRGLLGAVSYLSNEGMNVFSFLTFSLDGDDDNVYPHLQQVNNASSFNDVYHDRFDVSKLAQWEKVLEFADQAGVYMHFKTQETENDLLMDGGQLGRERKLYYRELIARFGHHLALNWNLGEENDIWQELSDPNNDIVRSYAQYIKDVDPYDHNIVIHSYPNQQDQVYQPLLGSSSELTGTSIQTSGNLDAVHTSVRKWVQESSASNKKWVVACDEPGSAQLGTGVDAGFPDNLLPEPRGNGDNRDAIRKQVLWGSMLAGGAGVEYYYGYQTGCDDLDCQDHRTRATKWADGKIAIDFFNTFLQEGVTKMVSANNLTSATDDYVFANEGEIYVIYLRNGGTTDLNLISQTGTYAVKWFDPRNGGSLLDGSVTSVAGGSAVSVGQAPNDINQDWVVLVTKDDTSVQPFSVLVYHETAGFRHGSINAGIQMVENLGNTNTWITDDSQSSDVFTDANLANYDVVIWMNTSGNGILNAGEQDAFENYIQNGGGFVGVHAATDTYRDGSWPWYNELVGAIVQTSPNHTSNNFNATMDVVGSHPAVSHLGTEWNKSEEYYYWELNGGFLFSDNIDLLQVRSTGSQSYDAPRPITWYKEYDGGRSFYTALGHNGSDYSSNTDFITMLEQAILWAGGETNIVSARQSADQQIDRDHATENLLSDEVVIFPNPVENILTVRKSLKDPFSVKLFNISGQVIRERSSETGELQVDMQGLTNGMYILEIYQMNSVEKMKVVKK